MPNPNAIVGLVTRVERDAIELEGGRRVPLDPEVSRLRPILEGASKQRLPVYLELDPASSVVARVLLPHVTRVTNVQPGEDGLDVELEMSHARHVLRRGAPDFAEIERQLRESMRNGAVIILTEDDAHNIIDVRAFRPGPDGPMPQLPPFPKPELPRWPWPFQTLRDWLLRFWRWRWWPWWWFSFRCMSATRAQQVFDAMSATTCDPLTVPPPCIPFMYPDDGCWGRAHEMCRLMLAMNVQPKKVWIQRVAPGWLHVDTRNNPNCYVEWGWHVAPTICVRRWLWWFPWARDLVIDPSLFTTPVTKAAWKAIQNNPGATLTDTDWTIFHLFSNSTDPTFAQTNTVLAAYRLQLQLRSLSAAGPPPYANCP